MAARVQGESRAGEVLIAEETFRRVSDAVRVEELGAIYVKGRVAPVPTHKVLGLRADPSDDPAP